MFTGIIEEIGKVRSITKSGNTLRLDIAAKLILSDVKIGDSIAVNGVCLTVTSFNRSSFCTDVMPVTFHATNLARLAAGSLVNLERAMAANGRFGGHVVSGHVDGIGKVISIKPNENAIVYTFEISSEMSRFCIAKGSIAIDGTSLTLVDVRNNHVTVSLIPHTRMHSIVGYKKAGDIVNIECDIMAKQYVKTMAKENKAISTGNSGITEAYLAEHGFI